MYTERFRVNLLLTVSGLGLALVLRPSLGLARLSEVEDVVHTMTWVAYGWCGSVILIWNTSIQRLAGTMSQRACHIRSIFGSSFATSSIGVEIAPF